MNEERSVHIIRLFLEAFREGNRTSFEDLLAPDSVFIHRPTGKLDRGAEAVVASCIGWRTEFSELSAEILDVFGIHNRVVAQLRWRGHHSSSDRSVDFISCCIYTLRDGKLVEIADYYDMATYQAQIANGSA